MDGDGSATDEDPTSALTADFAQTVHTLFSAGSVEDTLGQVVRLAVATIEGCDSAGVFLVDGELITTPVRTDAVVDAVDALQHGTGEGPCLDAIAHGSVVSVGDLDDDPRWPRFGPAATALGVRSVLALPLATDRTIGALNLYARYPEAFGVIDRARAFLLAGLAAGAYGAAETQELGERRAANLQAALASREVIGQAEGILMERERITADQAFDILRRASQHLNMKLREVARNLVETGERPDTGRPSTT